MNFEWKLAFLWLLLFTLLYTVGHCCGWLDFSEKLENRDPHFKEIEESTYLDFYYFERSARVTLLKVIDI